MKSDFAMLNEKLATHYGIPGVSGSQIRRVRAAGRTARAAAFLTQAAILKVTANGTTTSPVPRGAFVMDRLLGQPPEPPPPNIPAVEPDVRGATTIREQLDKHRDDAVCAVVPREDRSARLRAGSVRRDRRLPRRATARSARATRRRAARSTRSSASASSSARRSMRRACCPTGGSSADIAEFQTLLAADPERLLKNLAEQFAIYAHRPRRRRSATATRSPRSSRARRSKAAASARCCTKLVQSQLVSDQMSSIHEDPTSVAAAVALLLLVIAVAAEPTNTPAPQPVKHRVTGLFSARPASTICAEVVKKLAGREACQHRLREFRGHVFVRRRPAPQPPEARGNPERFDDLLRPASNYTFGIGPLCTTPKDKLTLVEIPVVGLDCKACCLAAYEAVYKIDGVERATASFKDGLITALINPEKTNRTALETALKMKGVTLKDAPPK